VDEEKHVCALVNTDRFDMTVALDPTADVREDLSKPAYRRRGADIFWLNDVACSTEREHACRVSEPKQEAQ